MYRKIKAFSKKQQGMRVNATLSKITKILLAAH